MAIKPLAIKVTAGIIGTGGAIVIAHQGYQALQNKSEEINKVSNSNKLISEKYTILAKGENFQGEWINILVSYREAVKNNNKLGFDNFDPKQQGEAEDKEAIVALKAKCDSALSSKDESLLDKARKWCVTPISVSALLEARGFVALKSGGVISEDREVWEKKIAAYRQAKAKDSNIAEMITNKTGPQIAEGDITEIKGKCKGLSTIMSHKETFKSSLENFQIWCANKQ